MTTYNNKELNFYKPKSGGKNKSDVDGFYSNSDDEHFFIKKPADKGELFTELFAGLLLQEFKNRKLIDEIYFPSLICADVIRFEDGSYGLIQPLVSFDELHKVIGTSYRDGSDRDPTKEAFFGPSYYTGVTKMGDSFGLSIALMFSLLLGAHSVHSGNIVVLKADENSKSRQYGRIDWGDAFRYFAHEMNNNDILFAYENRGFFNIKSLTKDYFLNYKNINGLFPAMADKAQKILPHLNAELLADIVSSALKKIPADLIDKNTQNKLAGYMVMPSFKGATFGPEGASDSFATEMGKLLERRMTSISKLQDFKSNIIPENMYASVLFFEPQVLSFKNSTSFSEIVNQWNDSLDEAASIKTDALDLAQLAGYFNQYVVELSAKTESAHLWTQNPPANNNIFMAYHTGNGKQIHGHAFVPQYKESTIINRFFTLDTQTFAALRFAGFEQSINDYTKANQGSDWAKIQALLQAGQQVITTLHVLNKAREFGMDDAIPVQIEQLKIQLQAFKQAEEAVQHILSIPHDLQPIEPNSEYSLFYPVSDMELNKMTGDQLATICLEESNSPLVSPLIERIVTNDKLWYRMEAAFESGAYDSRLDGVIEKIARMREARAVIEESREQTAKEIAEQKQHIIRLNKQVIAKTEEAAQLNTTLEQQINTTQSREKEIEELKLQAQTAKKELDRLAKQHKEDAQRQEQSHQEKLSAQEVLMNQLQEQVHSLEEANASLKSTVEAEIEKRSSTGESALKLQKQLEQLEPELERIKIELQEVKLKGLTDQKENIEQLKQQLDTKSQTILELRQQFTAATETQLSDEQNAQLVQEQLKTEIASLQSEQKKDKSEIDRLQMLVKSAKEAERDYKAALIDRQDIYFARMERMAPIMLQILDIEKKAGELQGRDETAASQAALKLATRLRANIQKYAENPEQNENVALNDFKIKATKSIAKSKGILGEHREEWKYILANITLGILLVGVGYAAAALINKQVTGNYTFFSKTESIKQVEGLEEHIASQTIQSIKGG
ncbi:LepB GTPase-activating domain-containing protein [uncultured Legionella sp.]|mgnify:CR=1 FL=1|uniref:LepB GTPase-activating domain-containing protein n=1 Tax=uncultured Legionella sp. TaxID=210934 RepID=UPI0026177435|nr:LepB GTPase-activating domain-containing protein [uncultured Legionella sp.]